jgi:hypothetical protein
MQIVPGSELDEQLGEGAFPKQMNAPGQIMDARQWIVLTADALPRPAAELTAEVWAPSAS